MKILIHLCLIAQLFGPIANAYTLAEKLSEQWKRFDLTRTALLTQVRKTSLPPSQRMISRSDWENLVNLKGPLEFKESDLKELKEHQEQKIKISHSEAIQNSIIDLNLIRQNQHTKVFCSELPKGGMIHIHESGALDRETVHRMLTSQDTPLDIPDLLQRFTDPTRRLLYPNEKQWLQDHQTISSFLKLNSQEQLRFEDFFFLPAGNHPFTRFESIFSFIALIEKDLDTMKEILIDFAKRAQKQNVIYTELREVFDPEYGPVLQEIEAKYGLMIRVNIGFPRIAPVEKIEEWSQQILNNTMPWVVGIDFLANEDGNSALDKGQLLYGGLLAANLDGKSKLHRTMHSGEIGDIRNPRDAMIMGVERLGHGVLLEQDLIALEYASIHKIPVEVNLASNLRLTHIQSIETHPFLKYLRLGLPISLSTDDEGIFDTDINNECELAINHSDITYAELKKMSFNSIETSFADDSDKAQLLKKLNQSFIDFEKRWVQKP